MYTSYTFYLISIIIIKSVRFVIYIHFTWSTLLFSWYLVWGFWSGVHVLKAIATDCRAVFLLSAAPRTVDCVYYSLLAHEFHWRYQLSLRERQGTFLWLRGSELSLLPCGLPTDQQKSVSYNYEIGLHILLYINVGVLTLIFNNYIVYKSA